MSTCHSVHAERKMSLEKNQRRVTDCEIVRSGSEVCPSFCSILLESTSDAWSSCRYWGSAYNGPHAATCYWPLSNKIFECSNQCESPDVCLGRMADRCLLPRPCLFPTSTLLPAWLSWLQGIVELTPVTSLSSHVHARACSVREGLELPRPRSRSGTEARPSLCLTVDIWSHFVSGGWLADACPTKCSVSYKGGHRSSPVSGFRSLSGYICL